jgi:hypothetical protein
MWNTSRSKQTLCSPPPLHSEFDLNLVEAMSSKKKRLLVGRFGISSERVVLEKVERKICNARFLYTPIAAGRRRRLNCQCVGAVGGGDVYLSLPYLHRMTWCAMQNLAGGCRPCAARERERGNNL